MRVQVRMKDHTGCGDALPDLKGSDEIDQRPHLGLGEFRSISMTDQADADGRPIDLIRSTLFGTVGIGGCGHMGACKLAIPAIGGLDHAIAESIAIADHEVVPETVQTSLPGFGIKVSDRS